MPRRTMSSKPNQWLVKSEPGSYSYDALERDGRTSWTGVRNFAARNHLRAMKPGELVAYYHTGDERRIVALARVASDPYPEVTADEGDWSAIDLAPHERFAHPVTLATIKGTVALAGMQLVRQPRLSVMPLTDAELVTLRALSKVEPALVVTKPSANRGASRQKLAKKPRAEKPATKKPVRKSRAAKSSRPRKTATKTRTRRR